MATGTIEKVTPTSGTGYCKMPDGTLMCWGIKSITLSSSDFTNWSNANLQRADLGELKVGVSFPVSFYSEPSVFVSMGNDSWAFVIEAKGGTTAIERVAIGRQTAYAGTYSLSWFAIGRWKA